MILLNKKNDILLTILLIACIFACKKDKDISKPKYQYGSIISKIDPENNTSDVSVGFIPSITFSNKVDTVIKTIDFVQYKVVVDYIKIYQDNEELVITEKWNSYHTIVSLFTTNFLKPNAQIKLEVNAHWEVFVDGNWIIPADPYYEKKVIIFNTVKEHKYQYGDIVAKTYPVNNTSDVGIGFIPSVKFLHKIDTTIKTVDLIDYRIAIDYLKVYQDNIELGFVQKWNLSHDSVSFIPNTPFKPNTQIKLDIKAHWEILEKGNWIKPPDTYSETKSVLFNTVTVSTTVFDANNIEYSYPLSNQYHYLQNESNKGFIKLVLPQDEFFQNSNFSFKVKITSKDGYSFQSAATYNPQQSMIEYNMPQNLANEKIYKLEFIKIEGVQENVNYTTYFRTSKFNNFLDKLTPFKDDHLNEWLIRDRVHQIYRWFENLTESFDAYEMMKVFGLIRCELDTSSVYYSKYLYPKLYAHLNEIKVDFGRKPFSYDSYPPMGKYANVKKYKVNFNTNVSNPPLNSSYLYQSLTDTTLLTDIQVNSNNAPTIVDPLGAGIMCYIADFVERDYNLASTWAFNKYYSDPLKTEWAVNLYSNLHPMVCAGDYIFKIKYVLPNGKVTSEKRIKLNLL